MRALRAAAALVALVLVSAQLAGIGHHVLVAHYACAVHGTLHHGSAPEARAVEVERQAALSAESEEHGTHDDCCFPARTPAEMDLAAGIELALGGTEHESEHATRPGSERHSAIPLLALAPKLSPPRA